MAEQRSNVAGTNLLSPTMGSPFGHRARSTLTLTALSISALLHAQEPVKPSATAQKAAAAVAPVPAATKLNGSNTQELDTGESLAFLGRKLWFEVKRRMNLTTEEEETQQRGSDKAVRLNVGSISVKSSEQQAK